MQNFTLGKKGITMLLFGLALLTTSFSSFGQENCPTVSNTTPPPFCYLSTVADLDAQANNDGVRWHRTATSNTAIPETELLKTGTYYAGNNSGTCTNRVSVNVIVDDIGAPTRMAGNIFAPCEYSSNVTSTVQDLIITVTGNAVEIYSDEIHGSPLDPNTVLIEGNSYFAGQRNPDTNCPSSRLALQYDPILSLAPIGNSSQRFCPGATVEKLEAQGTSPDFQAIRWYSTSTSFPQLSASTPLIHGETYYASQISNRINSNLPPCESIDRFEVTVTLEGATVIPSVQPPFCVDSNDPTTTPQVQDLVSPYGNPFFADANFTILLVPSTELVDGADYFTADESSCLVTRTVVEFAEIPFAGNPIDETLCQTQIMEFIATPALAVQYFSELIPADIDQSGTFSPSIADVMADFALNPIGPFESTYTLTNGDCTDSATIRIKVTPSIPANAGGPVPLTFCSTAGVQNLFGSLGAGANPNGRFEGLENGMFDPSSATIGDNLITFTVDGESGCVSGSDTATFTINVVQGPDAGQDGLIEVTQNAPPFNLFSELGGNPATDGTWSPGNADGSFDPATGTADNYTYTVTSGTCTDTAIVTVSIIIDDTCPIVAKTTQSFCSLIVDSTVPSGKRAPRIRDLTPLGTTWYDSKVETDPSPRNQPLLADHVYYAGNATGTCDNRTRVTVRLLKIPSAGSNTPILPVCKDDIAFNIIPFINDDSEFGPADMGGTFNPPFASNSTIFDPSIDAAGEYTYTVDNGLCDIATSVITIEFKVSEAANAGIDFPLPFCVTDENVNLFDELADGVTMTGTFTLDGEVLTDGIFSPSTSGEDDFTIIYTVGEDLSCVAGADSATILITVNAVPEAPVDATPPFCLVNNNTVADLVASGDNIVWYVDEDLTTVATATTPLEHGDVYYAVATGDNTCSSPSTMVTVTMNDSNAPTLPTGDNEFCRSDNPTLQELLDNLNGSGIKIYSSLSGGTAIASTTALENDVQYFATATDATSGCESSERLAIRVEVNFCGIPEGFSPNGDGKNDTFEIPDIAIDYPNYTIEVYNRWGNMVFKGNASTPDWDGISNKSGTLGDGVLPVGVYFYILNYNDGATTSEQGKLYLSR
jgi:gliding motility-associated-like protein